MKLSDIIPGGCHTYSKGNECFPANAPEYLVQGDGCYVTDHKGKKYIDWGMGLRSVILGHSYERVNHAVIDAVMEGTNLCRPTLYEKELAEKIISIIPSAEMVKFGKSGSDATSAAVKLAREYTKRPYVLVASENPFISQHDWFIGITPVDGGIVDTNTKIYNFETIEDSENDIQRSYQWENIAAIVLDPATVSVTKEKLQCIRSLCDKHGCVMILDEMISGFRYDLHGVQGLYGITPDLSTFGKAIGNGYSVSALCGKREIMQLGDRQYGNVFLLSGTYNAETTALAAAIATIEEIKENDVIKHTNMIGRMLVDALTKKIELYDLVGFLSIKCHEGGANPSMGFKNMVLKTIFDQHMVECGILMPYIAPSFSHKPLELAKTIDAADYALKMLSHAIKTNQPERYVYDGWVEKPVFRRFVKE